MRRQTRESSCRLRPASSAWNAWKNGAKLSHLEGPVKVGHGARKGEPALKRIARPGRRLGAVAEHPPFSVGATSDIHRAESQIGSARRGDAGERAQEFRISSNECGGNPALPHKLRRAIGVREHGFEQSGPLHETRLEPGPFDGIGEKRHVAQRPGALGAGWILIDPVEDAGIAQMTVSGGKSPVDLFNAEPGEERKERLPMGAHPAVHTYHFIKNTRERLIA